MEKLIFRNKSQVKISQELDIGLKKIAYFLRRKTGMGRNVIKENSIVERHQNIAHI
jgi:hypothetical protein